MIYVSTRGDKAELLSAQAIKKGLASDGGLFMPTQLPKITLNNIEELAKLRYNERAAKILSMFLSDYTYEELLEDCTSAYAEDRFPGGAAPVKKLNDTTSILELWHGPTCAFKDMALQIMPKLLSRALKKTGEDRTAVILVATSGDTGKAALEGYKDADQVKIIVFYPVNGVSRIQKLQMATQEGENVKVASVIGNFDDAQNGVKRIFSDAEAADILNSNNYFLSSANSINWGRLVPQIVYYISAYCDMFNAGTVKLGDEINVCVPTGNFGNIFAGYIAKQMGLPVKRFVCASNKNNVLTDFFTNGVYNRRRDFYTTMSPSMDILISSNLERLIWLLSDSETTASYMKKLSEDGKYEISAALKAKLDAEFTGLCCDESETASVINNTFKKYNYLIDTHTAVALGCSDKFIESTGDSTPMLVVSTASPYKFSPSVLSSLGGEIPADEFEAISKLNEISQTEVPTPISAIGNKKIRFDPDNAIKAEDMLKEVYTTLGI